MVFRIFSQWHFGLIVQGTPRRRRSAKTSAGAWSELLEVRCPPASLAGGASLMHDVAVENPQASAPHQGPQHVAQRKATALYPDMTGHWRLVTDFGDHQINSSLDVTQHGRKVTGTLTNDGQFPGKFKGKFQKTSAKSDEGDGYFVALALNPAFDSKFRVVMKAVIEIFEVIKFLTGGWERANGEDVPVHGTSLD